MLLCAVNPGISEAQSNSGTAFRITPGDRISISVYGEPDLTFNNLPVPTTGIIAYPFLGQIQAENRTEIELAEIIRIGLLDGYLLQPQVTVAITQYRPIFVGGAVRLPGQKDYSIGMDVERLIALAGGAADNADMGNLIIQRRGESGRYELQALQSTEVLPGDVVTIGERTIQEVIVEYYYLQGEVRTPGRYEFSRGLSVEQAIAIAGGFGLRASTKKISISRDNGNQTMTKVGLDSAIMPGDVITIGASLF